MCTETTWNTKFYEHSNKIVNLENTGGEEREKKNQIVSENLKSRRME